MKSSKEQQEEIREENNKMGKTKDHFKKIRDTKGTFHAKMGSINDRNGMDLTEAEDIKNCIKKILMTHIIMNVLSLTQSQTTQNVKSNGPQEASLQTKLVEVMDSN